MSVVKDKRSENLVIRARVREHLEDNFPGYKILEYSGTDYPYRIFITRKNFAEFMVDEAYDIEYTNFKNTVYDKDLKDFYAAVWTAGIYVLEKDDWYAKYRLEKAHERN